MERLRRRRRQRESGEDATAATPPKPPKSVQERYELTGRQLDNYLVALGCFSAGAVAGFALSAGTLAVAFAVPQALTFVFPLVLIAVSALGVGATSGLLTGCCGMATGGLWWRHLKLGAQLEELGPGSEEGAEQGTTAMAY